MRTSRNLLIFTRTPLHVGAGASVGAIDQPIQRERHTGFPIIPASSLKGSFADHWNSTFTAEDDLKPDGKRVRVSKSGTATVAAWLFGSDNDKHASAGALLFSEARLLAFPIRSARGSFAWITCPMMLQRAARDGVILKDLLKGLSEPGDDGAVFDAGTSSKLNLGGSVVLEEYTFKSHPWLGLTGLSDGLAALLPDDGVWSEVKDRLIILSNGMMSYFVKNACEIAQHVRINDETGTADKGGLFNQENVPSETLFYSVLHATRSRIQQGDHSSKQEEDALKAFEDKIRSAGIFQFGADASTGLGCCSVWLA